MGKYPLEAFSLYTIKKYDFYIVEGGTFEMLKNRAFYIFFVNVCLLSIVTLSTASNGIVSWWPADGISEDVVGSNNGTLMNGASYADGIVGKAFSFDGIDDYVEVAHNPSLDSPSALTVAAWIKRSSIAGLLDAVVVKRGADYGYALTFSDRNPNNIFFWINIPNFGWVYSYEVPIPMNKWTHVVAVFDGYRIRLFINGKLAKASYYVGRYKTISSAECPLNIGRDPYKPQWRFHGLIDEVKIYNRALTDQEIQAMCLDGGAGICYEPQSSPTCTQAPQGLVSWWPGDGDAKDIIGSNDGTLKNGASFDSGVVGDAFNLEWDWVNPNTVDDWIEVNDNPTLNITDQITLMAWINRSIPFWIGDPIIRKIGPNNAGYGLEFAQIENGIKVIFTLAMEGGSYWSTPPVPIGIDEWTHIAGTYDGTQMKLYWNGELVSTGNPPAGSKIGTAQNPLGIGGSIENRRFIGLIDEAAVFNRALNAEQIRSIYMASTAGMCKNEVSNEKPVANAGVDQTLHAGSLVSLNGINSADPDGNYPLIYSWQLISKPTGSSAFLSGSDTSSPTFIADKLGDYSIQLIVSDSQGLSSDPDVVLISTNNSAPVADAGPDQVVIQVGTQVYLDGSKSWDDNGDPITFFWSLKNKPTESTAILSNASSATPSFIADIHGEYVIQLIVSDSWSSSDIDTVTISFENIKPVAVAGNNQSMLQGSTVSLNGVNSFDPNLDPLNFFWSIISKPTNSTAQIYSPNIPETEFVVDLAGEYLISLIVNDGILNSEPSNISIVAISHQNATTTILQESQNLINTLNEDLLKNPKLTNTLTNKINSALEKINQGLYQEALDQLQNDILIKTNGCAEIGVPDKNDWIEDCQSQGQIYPMIIQAIDLLKVLCQQ